MSLDKHSAELLSFRSMEDAEEYRRLLFEAEENGADVNQLRLDGMNILHLAVQYCMTDVVRLLVNSSGNQEEEEEEEEDDDDEKQQLENDEEQQQENDDDNHHQQQQQQSLSKKRKSSDNRDENVDETANNTASKEQKVEKRPPHPFTDVNASTSANNETALHIATRRVQPELIRELLESRNKRGGFTAIGARDKQGSTAIYACMHSSAVDCLQVFLDCLTPNEICEFVHNKDNCGRNVLEVAESATTVRMLFEALPDDKERSKLLSRTTLHHSTRKQHFEVVRTLLLYGEKYCVNKVSQDLDNQGRAWKDWSDSQGMSALHLAISTSLFSVCCFGVDYNTLTLEALLRPRKEREAAPLILEGDDENNQDDTNGENEADNNDNNAAAAAAAAAASDGEERESGGKRRRETKKRADEGEEEEEEEEDEGPERKYSPVGNRERRVISLAAAAATNTGSSSPRSRKMNEYLGGVDVNLGCTKRIPENLLLSGEERRLIQEYF